jgi:hypothetical protein
MIPTSSRRRLPLELLPGGGETFRKIRRFPLEPVEANSNSRANLALNPCGAGNFISYLGHYMKLHHKEILKWIEDDYSRVLLIFY